MPDEMGSFRVDVEIENPARPGDRRTLTSVLVDTGAELSWVPAATLESLGIERYKTWRFRQADGTILERWVGGRLRAGYLICAYLAQGVCARRRHFLTNRPVREALTRSARI